MKAEQQNDNQDLEIGQEIPIAGNFQKQKSKINQFIAESIKNLQIIQQTYHKSYGFKHLSPQKDKATQNGQPSTVVNKSFPQSMTESYHRTVNSRRIKTKKTKKQHLPRSEYFYFYDMHQKIHQSSSIKLLNDYEAFQQMIINQDFSQVEKQIIKLSHYGNKLQRSSKSKQQMSNTKPFINHTQSFYHPGFGIDNKSQEKKPLSKSAVGPQVQLKGSLITEKHQSNKKHTKINKSKKHTLPNRQTLSKYTTPIRTIYLNKSQQSPQNQSTHSSVNKLSASTLLRNTNTVKFSQKPFLLNLDKDLLKKQKNSQNKRNLLDNKAGLSIVSSQRNWSNYSALQNTQDVKFQPLKPKQCQISNNRHKSHLLANLSLKNSKKVLKNQKLALESHRQSQSNSKKGLSLTQSTPKLERKSKLNILCNNLITKVHKKNSQKQSQILEKKLNQKLLLQSKRVQIRIY